MKKVGYSYYVHISNLDELLNSISNEYKIFVKNTILFAKNQLNLKFEIVKFDSKRETVSLIMCPTFDILNEPIVGDSYCFKKDFTFKVIKGNTKVYHHKWCFVNENYQGFDVDESKERSKIIEGIPNMCNLRSKIGQKDYWYSLLEENNILI